MIYSIANVRVSPGETDAEVAKRLTRQLGIGEPLSCRAVRRALDARKKSNIHFVCSYEVELAEPLAEPLPPFVSQIDRSALEPSRPAVFASRCNAKGRIVVIGAGPAGLFAALALAEAGLTVSLLERGKPVESRMRDIGRLRSRGELNPESNICFGEGGAGTYTDGKLYTRIKHPFLRWVLAEFVRFGASPDILVDAHPHLGSDKLVRIVRNMRHHLLDLGVDYRFEARVDELLINDGRIRGVRTADGEEIAADHVILATGHSARDTFEHLERIGIHMEAKSFAVGVRAEHPQALIDRIQFGTMASHPDLSAAEYALTHQVADRFLEKRGVYSFCMCPGGLIVPSPTEPGRMAVNGMSNAKRSGAFANSGIVVQVAPEDIARHGLAEGPLMGVALQRELEAATFKAAGESYAAPAMRLTDFLRKRASGSLAATRFKPGAVAADLWEILPQWLAAPLAEGIEGFGKKIRGYVTAEANLFGSETRTSSPVRVTRREDMQSLNMKGLYPAGEGAGYAGGIVSAAVDGLKAAEAIISQHSE